MWLTLSFLIEKMYQSLHNFTISFNQFNPRFPELLIAFIYIETTKTSRFEHII